MQSSTHSGGVKMCTGRAMEALFFLVFGTLYCTVLGAVLPQGGKDNVPRHSLDALDCRNPTAVRNGLVASVCNQSMLWQEEAAEQPMLILQYSTKHVVKAVRCEKLVSRLTEVCGSFSHTKLLFPPDIMQPEEFSPAECAQLYSIYCTPEKMDQLFLCR